MPTTLTGWERLGTLRTEIEGRRNALSREAIPLEAKRVKPLTGDQLEELVAITKELSASLDLECRIVKAYEYRRRNGELPAVQLPSEILGEIFLYACTRPPRSGEIKDVHAVSRTRSRISVTCYRWREVSLGTTALWSYISAEFLTKPFPKSEPYWYHDHKQQRPAHLIIPGVPTLCMQLQRAGKRPLDLVVRCNDGNGAEESILLTLAKVLPRCHSIDIDLWAWNCYHGSLGATLRNPPITVPVPLLHSITFQNLPFSSMKLDQAPQLRRVLSKSRYIDITLPSQLDRLVVVNAEHPQEFASLVRRHPTLRVLKWRAPVTPVTSRYYQTLPLPLALPALLGFSYLGNSTNPSALSLLHSLEAIQLQYLQLNYKDISPKFNQFPTLQCLDIPSCINDSTLIDIIKNIPSLIELILSRVQTASKRLVAALKNRDQSGNFELVPHLREMTCHFGDWRLVVDLLASRNQGKDGPDAPLVLHLYEDQLRSDELRLAREVYPFTIIPKLYNDPFCPDNWTSTPADFDRWP